LVATATSTTTSLTWTQKIAKCLYESNTFFHFSSFIFDLALFPHPKPRRVELGKVNFWPRFCVFILSIPLNSTPKPCRAAGTTRFILPAEAFRGNSGGLTPS
jgi:hypothetical protein